MNLRKRGYPAFSLVGALMVFFIITGYCLKDGGNIIWTPVFLVCTMCGSLVLGTVTGITAFYLFLWILSIYHKHRIQTDSQLLTGKTYRKTTVFFFSWLFIFLAWIPCFLAFFPGLCTYDSTIQIYQFLNNTFNDHHPLIHTLLIDLFYQTGSIIFHSPTVGIALYTIFQMLFLSGAFATGITLLHFLKARMRWLILLELYCCFYPFHMMLSISITKDVIFSALFLIQILLVYCFLLKGKNSFKITLMDLGLLLVSIAMMLARNNGRYVTLVFLALLFIVSIFYKKRRILYSRLLILMTVALLISTFFLSLLDTSLNAQSGDKREMLSVPIQQIARTVYYHPDMDPQLLSYANTLVVAPGFSDYNPLISDPVKTHFITSAVKNSPGEFLSFYTTLLTRYPGDFINALLTLDGGYLYFFDTSHAAIYASDNTTGLGYVQTFTSSETLASYNITEASLLPGLKQLITSMCNDNFYLKIPVLKYLFTPATWLWAFLFLSAGLFTLKRKEFLIPLALIGGYYLTCFLGPTVQLRYIYPVMISFPFIIILLGAHNKIAE